MLLALGVLTLGLISNEDSTQRSIHRLLPWSDSPDHCDPWSILWLLGRIAFATVALVMLRVADGRGLGDLAPRRVRRGMWLAACGAVIYWVVKFVGAAGGRCFA
jgi:hypothetical protein